MSGKIGIGIYDDPEVEPEPQQGEEVQPLAPQSLKASHVTVLPNVTMLYQPAQVSLPAPPAGLDWNRMLSGWCDFDVVRINGLT